MNPKVLPWKAKWVVQHFLGFERKWAGDREIKACCKHAHAMCGWTGPWFMVEIRTRGFTLKVTWIQKIPKATGLQTTPSPSWGLALGFPILKASIWGLYESLSRVHTCMGKCWTIREAHFLLYEPLSKSQGNCMFLATYGQHLLGCVYTDQVKTGFNFLSSLCEREKLQF